MRACVYYCGFYCICFVPGLWFAITLLNWLINKCEFNYIIIIIIIIIVVVIHIITVCACVCVVTVEVAVDCITSAFLQAMKLTFLRVTLQIPVNNYEINQRDALYRLIYYSKSAVHVSGDVFTHHQEHLTVLAVSGSVYPSSCWQQLGWTLPDTVNTVKCSWWWAKTSPETCRADL
jgi:hypothetical protein